MSAPDFSISPKILDRIPILWWWARGGGEVSMPQVSIDQTREIYTSFIFFFRWLFLISITPVTHTAKSPCSTVYLFHFVPVIHVTFVFNFFFNFIFQCSIQRLSTFKDRFMYIVYIDSAKRICAIIQSGQVFILWIYISLKTVERHVKSSRKWVYFLLFCGILGLRYIFLSTVHPVILAMI